MSDSDSDVPSSIKMPKEVDISDGKPEKKPRKKMEVSERKRAASSANLAKAREARAKKKADKLQAEDENQSILDELVAQQKAKKKAAKEKPQEQPEHTPVFGKPEKPPKKKHVPLSESEESEESEVSEESEESSSEDSDVEFVLKPAKKSKAKAKEAKQKAPKKSSILSEVEALKAEIAA